MAQSRNRPSPITIGAQPVQVFQSVKSRRQRTKEMLPKRLDTAIKSLRALQTFANTTHHDLKPAEQKRVTEIILHEVEAFEAAFGSKPGKLVPRIFEDE